MDSYVTNDLRWSYKWWLSVLVRSSHWPGSTDIAPASHLKSSAKRARSSLSSVERVRHMLLRRSSSRIRVIGCRNGSTTVHWTSWCGLLIDLTSWRLTSTEHWVVEPLVAAVAHAFSHVGGRWWWGVGIASVRVLAGSSSEWRPGTHRASRTPALGSTSTSSTSVAIESSEKQQKIQTY
jgi:hypothetical protein